MRRSPEPGRDGRSLRRFDGLERAVHWSTAVLVLVLVATGIVLYVPALSLAVGRRLVVEDLHVIAGIVVLVLLVLAVALPWGRQLADLAEICRLSRAESAWLCSFGERGRSAIGKFNPGQKLNTVTIGGLLTVLLGTGVVLRWGNGLADTWRTGATFVHDWFALAVVVLVTGHVLVALAHPAALRSMVTGRVSAAWRDRHAPAWRPPPERSPASLEPPASLAPLEGLVLSEIDHDRPQRPERNPR